MRRIFIIGGILLLAACGVEPGSEKWCKQKADQPKSEWTSSDAAMYARHCILDSTTVGSKEWCKDLSDKPKGEWTANDTASYAKYCVM
jgi:hypothetical protein